MIVCFSNYLTKIVYFFPSILTSVLGVPFESVLIGESGLMGIKILLFILILLRLQNSWVF